MTLAEHEAHMALALQLAQEAYAAEEIPVGAVIARGNEVIAIARNRRESAQDPTAHAEILAIQAAARALGTRRLSDCTLYVTLEPCPMCAGAMVMAELSQCYFAATDLRQGCGESVYALTQEPSFYHRLPCIGGLMAKEASALLLNFFQEKRDKKTTQRKHINFEGACACDH